MSWGGAHTQTYAVRPDGSEITPITLAESHDDEWGPKWAPDGSKIAYTAEGYPSINMTIYVVNVESLGAGPAQPLHSQAP